MTAVRVATKGDLDAVARTLARAFADDPVTGFVLPPGSPSRDRRLETFLRLGAKGGMSHESVLMTGGAEAVAVWKPPGHWKVGVREMLPAMPGMLYALRGRARAGMTMLTAIEKVHPSEPHWYLEILGTDPASQGKGHGSAVMAPVLARCDAEGVGAYLESSKERNIPFYERHGFRVTGEIDPPGGAPRLWAMWRDPRPA